METNPNSYIEIAVGSVSNRAIAIQPDELHKYIKPNQIEKVETGTVKRII